MIRTVTALLVIAAAAWAAPAGLQSTTLGRGPTIVLVHGLGGGRMGWMPTARKLMSSYRVVLIDLPGHGESPMPDPFTLESGAAAIDEVLATQKGESTVVVGQGMGALMALLALEAHPERARGLVAIEMSLKKQFSVPEQLRERFMAQLDQNYDTFLKTMFTKLGRDSAQGVAIHAQAAQVPAPTIKAYTRQMLSFDPSDAAKKAKMPLLTLVTDRLWKTAAGDSATLATTLGYNELPKPPMMRHLSNCGFLVASEQPDTLAAVIDRFSRHVMTAKTR